MKKRFLHCFLMFCFALLSKAQNLVPNPSFENHNCINARIENVNDWCQIGGSGGSCGFLSPCLNNSFLNTPNQYLDNCFQGFQPVRTGNTYIDIGTYIQSVNQESIIPYVKLLDTLEAGKTYCVTYYISMWNNARYSIDKLGALFTSSQVPCWIPSMSTPTIPIAGLYTPQVVTVPGVVFEDTLNWMEVSGIFTAVGNEAYMAIGDFFLHSQHLVKDSYPANCNGMVDYLVDDVSVEEVHPAKAKNDTTIMFGDSTIIGNNPSEAAMYNWQPSTGLSCTSCPNPKASPNSLTTYTVTKTQCKSVTTDVITVNVDATGLVSSSAVENGLKLYPNPANNILHIESRFEIGRMELINTIGQLLLSEPIHQKEFSLSLNHLPEGIYFVKVVYPNGISITKKVIKE